MKSSNSGYLSEFLNNSTLGAGCIPEEFLTDMELRILKLDKKRSSDTFDSNQLKFFVTMVILYRGIILGFLLSSETNGKLSSINPNARQ